MEKSQAWRIALIAASLLFIVMMAMHPGPEAANEHQGGGGPGAVDLMVYIVHGIAIVAVLALTFGALGLTATIGWERWPAVLALVLFVFAANATILAATLNGFVAPKIMAVLAAGKMEFATAQAVGSVNWWLNQALAFFHAYATAVAIALWALAWPFRGAMQQALRIAGLGAALIVIVPLASGLMTMDVNGVLLVSTATGLWLIAAALLSRGGQAA